MTCPKCTGAIAGHVAPRAPRTRRHGPRRHGARESRQSDARRPRAAVARLRPQPTAGVLGGQLHFARQGEARHLPVHGRRAVAAGDVRLQAAAQASATARSCPTRCGRASGSPACPAIRRRLPLAGSLFEFAQHGKNGTWVSDLLPHTAKIVDDLCIVRSMYTEAINHDPAITFFQTGSQIAGRPSMGAWLHYGLGSDNENLPAFVVLHHAGQGRSAALRAAVGQRLPAGAAPGRAVPQRQGRRCSTSANPDGVTRETPAADARPPARAARSTPRSCSAIPRSTRASRSTRWRIACRRACPDVMDLVERDRRRRSTLYGDDARTPGTFAANCLLARRLAERGVRFIQLYHPGWDHHGNLPTRYPAGQCRETDQAGRGADHRPEAARAARRHAGRLGRRVRPHAATRKAS